MPELLRLFFDLPEADVLDIRNCAVKLIKEGKTIMKVGAGGKEAEKQFSLPPSTMLFEANAALKHINPAVYGKKIRRTFTTVARFW